MPATRCGTRCTRRGSSTADEGVRSHGGGGRVHQVVAAIPGRGDRFRRFRTRGRAGSGVGGSAQSPRPGESTPGRGLFTCHARDRPEGLAPIRGRLRTAPPHLSGSRRSPTEARRATCRSRSDLTSARPRSRHSPWMRDATRSWRGRRFPMTRRTPPPRTRPGAGRNGTRSAWPNGRPRRFARWPAAWGRDAARLPASV